MQIPGQTVAISTIGSPRKLHRGRGASLVISDGMGVWAAAVSASSGVSHERECLSEEKRMRVRSVGGGFRPGNFLVLEGRTPTMRA